MADGFTTTCAISAYSHYCCEFESRSWRGVLDTINVIMFVSDLQQVGSFLLVHRLPPPLYSCYFVDSGILHHNPNHIPCINNIYNNKKETFQHVMASLYDDNYACFVIDQH